MTADMAPGAATLNDLLAELYESFLNDIRPSVEGRNGLSKPHLLKIPESYMDPQDRLMIVGQQTRGWGEDRPLEVRMLMDGYADFHNGRHRWKHTPFWSLSYQLANRLNPELVKPTFLWRNVLPVDAWPLRAGDRVGHELEAILVSHRLLAHEVAICKPDVVVCFTGPAYDDVLARMFPGLQFAEAADGVARRAFARLVHDELPERSFRTYHPNYLRQGRKADFIEALLVCVSKDGEQSGDRPVSNE